MPLLGLSVTQWREGGIAGVVSGGRGALLGLSVEGGGHCWGCQWREGGRWR